MNVEESFPRDNLVVLKFLDDYLNDKSKENMQDLGEYVRDNRGELDKDDRKILVLDFNKSGRFGSTLCTKIRLAHDAWVEGREKDRRYKVVCINLDDKCYRQYNSYGYMVSIPAYKRLEDIL